MRSLADETPIIHQQKGSHKQHSTSTSRIPAWTAAKSQQLVHVSCGMTGAQKTTGNGATGQELIRRPRYGDSYAD